MSRDLDLFMIGMNGEWTVDHYSLNEHEQLVVHYRSNAVEGLTWSHQPDQFENTPPVGTVGRIGFIWTRPKQEGEDSE